VRATFPKIDGSVPTSVIRSRYSRHALRSAVAWQGEAEQMAAGTTEQAYRLSVMAVESRDYAARLRQELRERGVTV
jgi:hypothetical protein